jgi:hypothetical protein
VGSYFFRREERKFEVDVAAAAFLKQEIAKHVPLFEFSSGCPHTHITTIYFDTRERYFYERAERSYDNNVKLRVKEYYYCDERGSARTFPHCFVELKERVDGVVYKRRFVTPKDLLESLLRGTDIWPLIEAAGRERGVRAANGGAWPLPVEDGALQASFHAYEQFRRYLEQFRVEPASIVNYRRQVFQRSEEELRITFDDEIAVCPALAGLYGQARSLTRQVLGKPKYVHDKVILEIKCASRDYPDWLQRSLRNHSSKPLSKFTTSVRFLTDSGKLSPAAECGGGTLGAAAMGDDTKLYAQPIER